MMRVPEVSSQVLRLGIRIPRPAGTMVSRVSISLDRDDERDDVVQVARLLAYAEFTKRYGPINLGILSEIILHDVTRVIVEISQFPDEEDS